MSNYTKTGNPGSGTRGLSTVIRQEFALIETAVNSKADINSPTLTGNPKAPTATPGDNSTTLATTAFVFNAALSATLPGQAGNGGKFLQTDGVNASWQLAIPAQSGNDGKFLTTNGTTASWGTVTVPPEVLLRID